MREIQEGTHVCTEYHELCSMAFLRTSRERVHDDFEKISSLTKLDETKGTRIILRTVCHTQGVQWVQFVCGEPTKGRVQSK